MPFSEVLGQSHAINQIKQAMQSDRIPHAWLFTGQAGTGKYKTAVALAQVLNCEQDGEDACGQCDVCLQISEQNYLDYRVVVPDGKTIKIAQIRQSLHWLQFHPDRAKCKVMILDGAQFMGNEAANAFLKTLEEPPKHTLLILIADSTHQMLETIVSRCQQVRFRPLSIEVIRHILHQTTDLTTDQIQFLSSQGMGSIRGSLATQLELMQTVEDTVIRWLTSDKDVAMEDILRTCDPWSKSKNEEWKLLLDFLETWFRDLAWLLHGLSEEKLIHQNENTKIERIGALKNCAQRYSLKHIHEINSRVANLRSKIELNANKALAIESLCLYILRSAA